MNCMATLKHISSKNSDYTAIETYLVYQHDAFTGKQLLDEQGKPKLRDSYVLDTLECGDFSFATACLLANRKYGKNTQHGDIKSHQYIISFDPRDAADNGLTMEKAQALGLKFCEENFPGHPAIVCTHPDGHNHSGNIHVHIVIGSVRTREVERKPYMQKPRDWREGMKHSSTAQTMRHLRVEVMELCEGAGLYQIDLLNGSKERVSEAEYWARRRGQQKLDLANAALAAAGQQPKQKKFETVKDDEFKQLEENILKEGKLISPLIVWGNTLVDGHNRYEIVQEHPEISFSTMPLPFESREEVLAWICKNQLGRRNLTPEQKKFLIGKQYSVEHRKPGGNGNNQHTAAAKKTAPEELCQIDTIPPTSAEASVRKQIAERNNVSESYVARSEKFMRGVEIMEQMMPGTKEKILSGQFKVRDADMHRLARADFPNRKQIVHEILHPEDRPAPQSSYSHYSGINYSALEVAVRRIQQDFDFLMRYLPKLPDDSYAKTETLKILKQHKAYMAQFEELLNDEKIA